MGFLFDAQYIATVDLTISADKKTIQVNDPKIHKVTNDVAPDPEMEKFVQEQMKPLKDPRLLKELAVIKTTLDGRFLSIRTQETGLGNLVCDASKFTNLSRNNTPHLTAG